MRITDIRVDTLSIGPTLVRVVTDEGVVGLSEVGWQDPRIFRGHLERVIKPQLIGADPLQPGRHWERLVNGTRALPYPTTSAFAGCHRHRPVGHHRARSPACRSTPCWAAPRGPTSRSTGASAPGSRRHPSRWSRTSCAAATRASAAFKIRMDWGPVQPDVDPAKDIEMARRCREALGPDVWIGFDANRGYSVGTAIRQGRKLEELGFAHFEEPLPEQDLAGLREVCRALDIPVSTGEQLKRPLGLPRPHRARATRTSSSRTSSMPAGSPR